MIDYDSPLTEEFLRTGKCASCPVIDLHAHMFNTFECNMLADTPERVLADMDRSGVLLSVFCSHDALFGGSRYIPGDVDVAKKYPDRFLVYMTVFSPLLDSTGDLEFAAKSPEIVGLKFHGDTYKIPISDPRHKPYLRFADERCMPVLFHTWAGSPYDGPEEAEKILGEYQQLRFIAGHSFRGDPASAIRLARKYDNLYLELTAVLSQQGMVDSFVDAGLEDRIVFGVDAPWFSYDFGIGALLSARMSDEVRRKILYRNAANLLQTADIRIPQSICCLE